MVFDTESGSEWSSCDYKSDLILRWLYPWKVVFYFDAEPVGAGVGKSKLWEIAALYRAV